MARIAHLSPGCHDAAAATQSLHEVSVPVLSKTIVVTREAFCTAREGEGLRRRVRVLGQERVHGGGLTPSPVVCNVPL
jgi:precorrin-4 methylase